MLKLIGKSFREVNCKPAKLHSRIDDSKEGGSDIQQGTEKGIRKSVQ